MLDGPKGNQDLESVSSCAEMFDQFSKSVKNCSIHEFSKNRGLRQSVLEGVNLAFREVDYLIVLEDDCMIGPSTMEFFGWAFEALNQIDQVGVISGHYVGPAQSGRAFLSQRFSSWGWATTSKVWSDFLNHPYSKMSAGQLVEEIPELIRGSVFPQQLEYRLIMAKLHSLDSWALPFDSFLRASGLKALKPKANQIRNIGFGNEATHTQIGKSLSRRPAHFALANIEVESAKESLKTERSESWRRLAFLARDWIRQKFSK